jgi:phosphoribosylformylglycinamidine cyclo-ligase
MTALPRVPPVLSFIQKEAGIDDQEAYGIFNMGAGFALFVSPADADRAMEALHLKGFDPLQAGIVEAGPKRVVIEPLGLTFAGEDLQLRA